MNFFNRPPRPDSKAGLQGGHPVVMGKALGIVYRAIATHLARKAGYTKDSDGDGVTDDADYCPGTVIPEAAPTIELRTNNFALADDDRIFDTKDPNGVGPEASFDIFDTAGCSCEQIVVEQGLGKGHLKFGCSLGEMEEWVEWVNLP